MNRRSGKINCLAAGGIGCGVLFVLFVVGSIFFWRWFTAYTPIVPAEHFMDADTRGFLVVRFDPDDVQYALQVIEQANDRSDNDDIHEAAERLDKMPDGFRMALPAQAVLIVRKGEEEGTVRFGAAISLARFLKRFSDLAEGAEAADLVWRHEDIPITSFEGEGKVLAPVGNSLMLATDTPLAVSWIDIHQAVSAEIEDLGEDTAPEVPQPELHGRIEAAYDRVDAGALVRFAMVNDDGEVTALYRQYIEDEKGLDLDTPETRRVINILEQALSISGHVLPRGDGGVEGTLWTECTDSDSAAVLEKVMRKYAADCGAEVKEFTDDGPGYDGCMLLKMVFTCDSLADLMVERSDVDESVKVPSPDVDVPEDTPAPAGVSL